MTQNKHFKTICCRPEVDCDVISGGNVKTIESYAMLNFEVASLSSFRDIKKSFVTAAAETNIDDSIRPKRKRAQSRSSYFVDSDFSGTIYINVSFNRRSSESIKVFIYLYCIY